MKIVSDIIRCMLPLSNVYDLGREFVYDLGRELKCVLYGQGWRLRRQGLQKTLAEKCTPTHLEPVYVRNLSILIWAGIERKRTITLVTASEHVIFPRAPPVCLSFLRPGVA